MRLEEPLTDEILPRQTPTAGSDSGVLATVDDPARLATLQATGLLDSEVEEVFDRLTRLAVKVLSVPAAFLSLVDSNRDFYKSASGFGEPLRSKRELTGRTFCHYAIQSGSPLVIDDTVADPVDAGASGRLQDPRHAVPACRLTARGISCGGLPTWDGRL